MQIYATGMNPADCNALRRVPRVAIFQAFGELVQGLKAGGATIEWRRTLVGDALPPSTEALVVSMLLPRSLNCPYALGALWAISEALRSDIPIVLYLTDWAFFAAEAEYRSIARAGTGYFQKTIGGSLQYNEPPDQIARHGEALIDVCRQYPSPSSQLWSQTSILIPKYTGWGSIEVVRNRLPVPRSLQIFPFDPTPAFIQHLFADRRLPILYRSMEERKKHWLWPSLLKDDAWVLDQKLGWPVDRFGPRGFPVVDDEQEVHKLYRQRAGAICPPYPHVGSGWWRSRWIHAALAGSVLLCGTGDDAEVGSAYAYNGSDFESMSDERLARVADAQRGQLEELLQLDGGLMIDQARAPFRAFDLS